MSRGEEKIIDAIFEVHGSKDKWTVVEYTHDLPEWVNPNGSSIPITYEQVLRIQGLSSEDIEDILDNIATQDIPAQILGRG